MVQLYRVGGHLAGVYQNLDAQIGRAIKRIGKAGVQIGACAEGITVFPLDHEQHCCSVSLGDLRCQVAQVFG